jgi:hypothetical protein
VTMKRIIQKFFAWHERNLALNNAVVTFLFVWQLAHLFWLTAHVVLPRLFGTHPLDLSGIFETLIVIADYVEVPAILGASVLYINFIKKGEEKLKSIAMLLFINSQWLHIFWITDEFVINQFAEGATVLPVWLAWLAIFIDYLELPVIYDTLKRTISSGARILRLQPPQEL